MSYFEVLYLNFSSQIPATWSILMSLKHLEFVAVSHESGLCRIWWNHWSHTSMDIYLYSIMTINQQKVRYHLKPMALSNPYNWLLNKNSRQDCPKIEMWTCLTLQPSLGWTKFNGAIKMKNGTQCHMSHFVSYRSYNVIFNFLGHPALKSC